jgi:hypothetical protein
MSVRDLTTAARRTLGFDLTLRMTLVLRCAIARRLRLCHAAHPCRRSDFSCSKTSRPSASIRRNPTAFGGHWASRASRIASAVSRAAVSTSRSVFDRPK